MKIKIIIADDHPLFRTALSQTIKDYFQDSGLDIDVLESEDMATTHALLDSNKDTSLIMLDLHMPDAQGFSGLVNLKGCYPDVPLVMISGSDASHITDRALTLGAAGFISKSAASDTIGEAIAALLKGEKWFPKTAATIGTSKQDLALADIVNKVASLTPHQFRVFTMVNEGLLNKQIAYELGISEATVKSHIKMIFKKMDVRKRTEIIILANALQVDSPGSSIHST